MNVVPSQQASLVDKTRWVPDVVQETSVLASVLPEQTPEIVLQESADVAPPATNSYRAAHPDAPSTRRVVDASAHVYVVLAKTFATAGQSVHTISASAVHAVDMYFPDAHDAVHTAHTSAVSSSTPTAPSEPACR